MCHLCRVCEKSDAHKSLFGNPVGAGDLTPTRAYPKTLIGAWNLTPTQASPNTLIGAWSLTPTRGVRLHA